MSLTTRVGLLAGAAALTLTGVSNARPAGETANNGDQSQRIASLEAEVAAMKAAQNENWLTEQRASEIRGLVQDVLADADTRASLLQTGMTAGYDNGAVIGSADGNWLLRTNILLQTRFIWAHVDDGDTGLVDQNRYGFEPTRMQFYMSGHVVNPSWYYMISVNIGTGGEGRNGLLDGYVGHDFGNGLKLQMGAMKSPFLREEMVGDQYQLAVERSSVNYFFTTGYADGLMVSWEGDKFRAMGMLSDGANTGNTPWIAYDTEMAITARLEWLASGNWDQFKDQTSPRGSETGILVGGAIHWQKGEFGTPATEVDLTELTGDVSAEFGGFNLFGSITWADVDPGSSNPIGIVVQGGYYLADTWEIYGRFEWTDQDVPGSEDFEMLTVGVNKYFSGHNVKWTTDVGFAFNEVQLSTNTLTGLQSDISGSDNQVVVRTQWQILF